MAHRITNPPRRPRITETTIEASCKQEDHFYTARRSRNQSSAELHSISIYRNPRSSRRFLERGIHSASRPDVPWLLTVPRRSRREAQIFGSAAVFGRRNFGRLWCSGLPHTVCRPVLLRPRTCALRLVAAPPRCDVSQNWILRSVGKLEAV